MHKYTTFFLLRCEKWSSFCLRAAGQRQTSMCARIFLWLLMRKFACYIIFFFFAGHVSKGTTWQQNILVLLIIMVIFVATTQCFTGYDVLRWRSFYAREDNAWKAHYMEVFDHGIREAMCCLGRSKYL